MIIRVKNHHIPPTILVEAALGFRSDLEMKMVVILRNVGSGGVIDVAGSETDNVSQLDVYQHQVCCYRIKYFFILTMTLTVNCTG